MSFTRYLSVLSWLCFAISLAPAAEPLRPGGLPDGVNPGELKVVSIGNKEPQQPLQLPLTHTEVKITVAGFVARATVTQDYTNPFAKPIEAVYVFPLPHKAAVDGMTMHVGDRVIRGLIKKREEARQIYQQAKAEGKRTALLEQERPNIFTQSVGNIMPGDKISIEITYVDMLEYQDEGSFELVFPMVVGPRYIPGVPHGKTGTGFAQDTDRIPDASRITPPVLKPGERSGHDIELTVDLDAHLKIQGLHSTSHRIDVTETSDTQRKITLHPTDTIPNKDFVLRYEVAGTAPEVAVIAYHDPKQGGYFTLIALPQRHIDDASTVPRDLIFLLDTSGSMMGFPLDKSKEAMYKLLHGMRATDRFNVLRFSGDTGTLWPEPRANTPQNLAEARKFVEGMEGGGGTEMEQGIHAALSQPAAEGRMRIAFLLTDGYVGEEAEILASIERERRGARMFTLGVGSSVNRYLLDQAAAVGLGEAFYVRQDEDATSVIDKFFKRVDRPNLANIEIDWKGLDVTDLTPARIPDLWQGQPIMVHGRYQRGGDTKIVIHGALGAKEQNWDIPVSLPSNSPTNAVMATVWARAKVQELMFELSRHSDQREQGIAEITNLGLQYQIMTQWTSFVAVEEQVVNKGGAQQTVTQPVELPEGVDYEGAVGSEAGAVGGGAANLMAIAPSPTRAFSRHSGVYTRGIELDSADTSPEVVVTSQLTSREKASPAPDISIGSVETEVPIGKKVVVIEGLPYSQSVAPDTVVGAAPNATAPAPAAPPAMAVTPAPAPTKEEKDGGGWLNWLSPTPKADVKAMPTIQSSAVIGSVTPPAAKTEAVVDDKVQPQRDATDTSGHCYYKALAVSGSIRYPDVVQQLNQLWPNLCVELASHVDSPGTVGINLVIGTDGKVMVVTMPLQSPMTKQALEAIETAFKGLNFKTTIPGETKISLVLVLK